MQVKLVHVQHGRAWQMLCPVDADSIPEADVIQQLYAHIVFIQSAQFVDTWQTVKYILVSISILFLTSGQMLTVDFVPGIFFFLSQYEWRSTGLF